MRASPGVLRLLVLTPVHWKDGKFYNPDGKQERRGWYRNRENAKNSSPVLGMTLYPSSFLCIVSGFLTCLILCPEILSYEKYVINWSFFLINLFCCNLVSPPHLQAVLLIATRQSFALPAGTSHGRAVLGNRARLCRAHPASAEAKIRSPRWVERRFCTDITSCVAHQAMPVWEKIMQVESSCKSLPFHSQPHGLCTGLEWSSIISNLGTGQVAITRL